MRISVELILSLLSQGATQEELLDDYPGLELEDIRACIAYAHTVRCGSVRERSLATEEASPSRSLRQVTPLLHRNPVR